MITKDYIESLKNKGNGDLAHLLQNQKDNPTIVYILENIGYLPKNFDGKVFIPFLSHEFHKIRLLAAKNIAKANKPEYLETLWKCFQNEQDTAVRREIVSAIGRLRNEKNNPYLLNILADHDPKVVCQAIRGLLVFADNQRIVEQLKPLVNQLS